MKNLTKFLNLLVTLLVSVQLVSCGTILYPERRNQKAGRIDVGVALLDGFWLLVGIIPGVIAFAVDFSSGAIYLPAGSAKNDDGEYRVVRFDPKTTSQEGVEEIISRETGQTVSFDDRRLELTKVKSADELPPFLSMLKP